MSIAGKLQSTRLEYRFEDESGYHFKVVCEKEEAPDPDGRVRDRGWRATVTMTSGGLVSPEAAIESLLDSARTFVRQASATRKATR